MNDDLVSALFLLLLGGGLLIHCSRETLREYRSGIGMGILGSYPRDKNPVRYWTAVIATALASVLGLLLFIIGLGMLITLGSTDL